MPSRNQGFEGPSDKLGMRPNGDYGRRDRPCGRGIAGPFSLLNGLTGPRFPSVATFFGQLAERWTTLAAERWARLFQAIDFDNADAAAAVLSGEDGGEGARRQ